MLKPWAWTVAPPKKKKFNKLQCPQSEYDKHLTVEHQTFFSFHHPFFFTSPSISLSCPTVSESCVAMATQSIGILPTRTSFPCFILCSPSCAQPSLPHLSVIYLTKLHRFFVIAGLKESSKVERSQIGQKKLIKQASWGVNVLFVFVNRLCQDREEREGKEMKRQSKRGGNKYNEWHFQIKYAWINNASNGTTNKFSN